MIYLLYGNDTSKSRDKLHSLVESLRKKKPDATFAQFDEETLSAEHLPELIGGQGLFERKLIVSFDNVARSKTVGEEVMKSLKEFYLSESIFIFLEGKLDKKTLSKFQKYGEKVQEFSADVKEKGKGFSIWSLGDALGRRDKKALWSKYREALGRGIPVEEIHGVLFWQLKCMLLALSSQTASTADLNPFVFKKSQGFIKNYSEEELTDLSNALVSLSHDARRGMCTFSIRLERFTLAI